MLKISFSKNRWFGPKWGAGPPIVLWHFILPILKIHLNNHLEAMQLYHPIANWHIHCQSPIQELSVMLKQIHFRFPLLARSSLTHPEWGCLLRASSCCIFFVLQFLYKFYHCRIFKWIANWRQRCYDYHFNLH